MTMRISQQTARSVPRLRTHGVERAGFALAALLLAGLNGCAPSTDKPAATGGKDSAAARAPASIVFTEGDYGRAVARAKRDKKPLFVDAWAPWCHTCLSMRSYVFDTPEMKAHAADFVWLAMNTETPPGEDFLQKFPMSNWPTLWVLDPETEKPLVKWIGSATATELAAILDDVKSTGSGEAAAAKLAGDRASAEGNAAEAITQYRVALSKSTKTWPARPRVAEALSMRYFETKAYREEALLADAELPSMPAKASGTSRANVALNAMTGAAQLPEADPLRNLGARRAIVESIARDPSVPMLADDRSSLFEALVDLSDERGEKDEAKRIAAPWSEFLDAEAAAAPDAAARAVFDAHRLEAYLALGTPARAIAMLQESERDFPEDYNPPARLARAQLAAGQKDEALVSIDRALGLGYGPRMLRLYATKVEIQRAAGDKDGEKKTLEKALSTEAATSAAGAKNRTAAELQSRLDELNGKK